MSHLYSSDHLTGMCDQTTLSEPKMNYKTALITLQEWESSQWQTYYPKRTRPSQNLSLENSISVTPLDTQVKSVILRDHETSSRHWESLRILSNFLILVTFVLRIYEYIHMRKKLLPWWFLVFRYRTLETSKGITFLKDK